MAARPRRRSARSGLWDPCSRARARRQHLAGRAVRRDRQCGGRHHRAFAGARAAAARRGTFALHARARSPAVAPAHGAAEARRPAAASASTTTCSGPAARGILQRTASPCRENEPRDGMDRPASLSLQLGAATLALLLPAASARPHAGRAPLSAARASSRPWSRCLSCCRRPCSASICSGVRRAVAARPPFAVVHGHSLAFSFQGLVLASAIANIPFVVQPIQRAFESIPRDVREAAACCGMTPWRASCGSSCRWHGPASSRPRS